MADDAMQDFLGELDGLETHAAVEEQASANGVDPTLTGQEERQPTEHEQTEEPVNNEQLAVEANVQAENMEEHHGYEEDIHHHEEAQMEEATVHQEAPVDQTTQEPSESDIQDPLNVFDDEKHTSLEVNFDEVENTSEEEFQGEPPEFTSNFADNGPPRRPFFDPYPHRHYVSLYPVCNKLLALKWDQRQKGRLQSKIRTMKYSKFSFQDSLHIRHQLNAKKKMLEENRKREIQRTNEILVQRMVHILKQHKGGNHRRNGERFIMRKNYRTPLKIQMENRIRKENEVQVAVIQGPSVQIRKSKT